MGEFGVWRDGKHIQVYDLEKSLTAIRIRNEMNEDRIAYLEKENKRLREEYDKDEEVKELKEKLEEMRNELSRGFSISKEEQEQINEWKKKHEADAHGLKTRAQRMRAMGTIGGRYHYEFRPTSIGTVGKIVCSCGAEFEFQSLS